MSNHITIEFCQEDRKRIDELIGMAGWIVGALKDMTAPVIMQDANGITICKAMDIPTQPEPVTEHPVDEVSPHAAPDPDQPFFDQAPTEPTNFTKADVQALVLKLAAPGTGKKDAVKAIVNEYAKKVSDIPEEKLNEVMAKLQKLAEEE